MELCFFFQICWCSDLIKAAFGHLVAEETSCERNTDISSYLRTCWETVVYLPVKQTQSNVTVVFQQLTNVGPIFTLPLALFSPPPTRQQQLEQQWWERWDGNKIVKLLAEKPMTNELKDAKTPQSWGELCGNSVWVRLSKQDHLWSFDALINMKTLISAALRCIQAQH